jgi:hypothetical protein
MPVESQTKMNIPSRSCLALSPGRVAIAVPPSPEQAGVVDVPWVMARDGEGVGRWPGGSVLR